MTVVRATPRVGGDDAELAAVWTLLLRADEQEAILRATRIANDHEPDDPVAGERPTRDDGTVNSYRLRLAELERSRERLAEAYPHLMPRIEQMVSEREASKRRDEAAREEAVE